MSRRRILKTLLMLAILPALPPEASALILTDTVQFLPASEVVDTASGNQVNFSYTHPLSGFDPARHEITGVSLTLFHRDNANEGPTRELWQAAIPEAGWTGWLSGSEGIEKSDAWILPESVWEVIKNADGPGLLVTLSEMTSFNSEKMLLYKSAVEISYRNLVSRDIAPEAPEPSALLTLPLALLAWAAGRTLRHSLAARR